MIYNTTTPVSPATNHVDWFFANELTATYEKALLYNYTQVAGVQDGTFYYSKTNFFQYIKDEYGQYTHDVLVGKFIHLSNQFKDMFALTEWHMYGSSRLGVQKPAPVMLNGSEATAGRELVHIEFEGTWNQYTESFTDTSNTTTTTYQISYDYFTLTRGEKNYELINHVGNVMVVVSDKRIAFCSNDTVNYYTADVLQATDYSAFGVILKDRDYYADTSSKYRFGYQGSERDNEVSGSGNAYTTHFRELDPRLGRWLTVDPMSLLFESPYVSMGNNPVWFNDFLGNTFDPTNGSDKQAEAHKGKTTDLLKNANERLSDVNNDIKKLENKLSKNPKKDKWIKQLQNLKNQKDELQFKVAQFEDALCELDEMASSGQVFRLEQTTAIGPRSYMGSNGEFVISFASDGELAHELKHGYQYIHGFTSFDANINQAGMLHDIHDEVEGILRQHAYENVGFKSYKEINARSICEKFPHQYINTIVSERNLTIHSLTRDVVAAQRKNIINPSDGSISHGDQGIKRYMDQPIMNYYKRAGKVERVIIP